MFKLLALIVVVTGCLGFCGCNSSAVIESRNSEDTPKVAGICKYGHKNRGECGRFAYHRIAEECGEEWAMILMREWGGRRENCDEMEADD